MQTSIALDYLSATSKQHSINQVLERFAFGIEFDLWITAKALNGYEHALKHPYGHIVSWNTKRDDMGINVLFTGLPLKELHDRGNNNLEMIRKLFEAEFKFSRIDLAIDIHGVKVDLEELQRAPRTGSVNKLPVLIKDGPNCEEGATLYIGSWQSDKFIRIYDKAGEQELNGILWTRCELVVKGRTATKIAARISIMKDEEVGKFTQGVILGMYNPENEVFQQAMDAEPERVASTKDINHGTYDWLMSSVSKTLARVILELPHRNVEQTFMKEVQKHIRELAAQALTKSAKP